MVRRCLCGCGTLIARGSYAPGHDPNTKTGHWSPNRDRTAQARFRRLLMARAGGRCEYVWVSGDVDRMSTEPVMLHRCTQTTDLRACHITPLSKGGGYGLSNGALLCREHDKQTDRYAR